MIISGIVMCLHGNEKEPLIVSDKIKYPIHLGNIRAFNLNKRFIHKDMNRVFGLKGNSYEEKRARTLLKKLKKYERVIDIHTTTSDIDLFAIITKQTKEKMDLVKSMGIKKCVIIDSLSHGNSLIDSVKCGISLEIGRNKNMHQIVNCFNNPKKVETEFYKVVGTIKSEGLQNFKKINGFYPVLVGEEAYKGECLKAIKLK